MLGDEKRDLDDYLQNGWLQLIPPMSWLIEAQTSPLGYPLPDRYDAADHNATAPDGGVETSQDSSTATIEEPDNQTWLDQFVDDQILSQYRQDDEQLVTPFSLMGASMRATDLTTVLSDESGVPALELFGPIPSYQPTVHPANKEIARDQRSALRGHMRDSARSPEADEDRLSDDERTDAIENRDIDKLKGWNNPLWDLTFRDVAGLDAGYRGPNPLGHFRNSRDYFVTFKGDGGGIVAYDHKRDVLYNPITYFLCDEGVRSVDSPNGELSEREKFGLWLYAKRKGLVTEATPIPLDALIWFAQEQEIITDPDEQLNDDGIFNDMGDYRRAVEKLDEMTKVEVPRLEESEAIREQRRKEYEANNAGESSQEETNTSDEIRLDAFKMDLETSEDALRPEEQFLMKYLTDIEDAPDPGEVEDIEQVKSDLPVTELMKAYNNWISIQKYVIDENNLECPHDLKTRGSVGFGSIISQSDKMDWNTFRSNRRGNRPTYVLGKEFTNNGNKLLADLPENIQQYIEQLPDWELPTDD